MVKWLKSPEVSVFPAGLIPRLGRLLRQQRADWRGVYCRGPGEHGVYMITAIGGQCKISLIWFVLYGVFMIELCYMV